MTAPKLDGLRSILALLLVSTITGCALPQPDKYREPEQAPITLTQTILKDLPKPNAPVPVAVYEFEDKTGQFKPQENVQTLSRAVSQGGAAILVKALRDAGDGQWFRVLERSGLDNLLKERQIIREMRSRYLGEEEINPKALPPLLFAGVVLEGGIVGFDTNTLTGGLGARFLGIGGSTEYRQNTVTVNLRAVSVKTGEVLANVTTSKTLASIGVQGGTFKFVSFDKLLEIEAGFTDNEPNTLALRRTVEKAVHSLIVEGSQTGLWAFADADAGKQLVAEYKAEQSGIPLPPKAAPKPQIAEATTEPAPATVPRTPVATAPPRPAVVPQPTTATPVKTALDRRSVPAPKAVTETRARAEPVVQEPDARTAARSVVATTTTRTTVPSAPAPAAVPPRPATVIESAPLPAVVVDMRTTTPVESAARGTVTVADEMRMIADEAEKSRAERIASSSVTSEDVERSKAPSVTAFALPEAELAGPSRAAPQSVTVARTEPSEADLIASKIVSMIEAHGGEPQVIAPTTTQNSGVIQSVPPTPEVPSTDGARRPGI